MDETTALPACLTDPSILYVEVNDWGDMLYMVQKRLDGKRSGWFVVTIAGERSFWDGPYSQKSVGQFLQYTCLLPWRQIKNRTSPEAGSWSGSVS